MRWHERIKIYSRLRPLIDPSVDEKGFWNANSGPGLETFHEELGAEFMWSTCKRPFYNVYPHVRDGLRRVPLSLPCEQIVKSASMLPMAMSIRFPVGGELEVGDVSVGEFLCQRVLIPSELGFEPGISVWCNYGANRPRGSSPAYYPDLPSQLIKTFPLIKGQSVEDVLAETNFVAIQGGLELSNIELEAVTECVRVSCGVSLMAHDPRLVEPIVLKSDEAKYRETGDRKYVEKAIRRGVFGFNVGANIEVSPHYRRAHFALRWTGKGRETPKIVPVKGCVVRRQSVTEVPTGYLDDLVEA